MSKINDRKFGFKTADLFVTPLTREELSLLIEAEEDAVIKAEYETILEACNEDPENGIWRTYWQATERKGAKNHVGGFWFLGAPNRGTVSVKFRIFDEYKGKKYGTQGLRYLIEWALVNKVYVIEAEVDAENSGAISVLDRSGFVYRDGDWKLQKYSYVKPKTSWAGVYFMIGILTGMLIGIVINSMIVGTLIGVVIGLLVGTGMDVADDKNRETITGERPVKHGLIRHKKK